MATKFKGDYDRIRINEFIPPSYVTSHFVVMLNGAAKYRITFAVGPSSLNESRSNNFQTAKTNNGWFMQRLGPSPIQLSFSGYMLDTEGYLEKHQFLSNWKSLIEDQRVAGSEYKNDYTVKFICMGREYYGVVNAINISTDAQRQLLHTYSISMTCFSDQYIYKPGEAKITTSFNTVTKPKKQIQLSPNLFTIMTRE